jgi:hypothetical protein
MTTVRITLDSLKSPLTPQRGASDRSIVSPNSVMMVSRRFTLHEMHECCCMLDYSGSSLDGPPVLPSRHSLHGLEEDERRAATAPQHKEDDKETSTCDLSPRLPSHYSRDNIVQVLLPGSPTNKRASFTFSRSVSELPRAGASCRRRRSSPQMVPLRRSASAISHVESTLRSDGVLIFPSPSA